MSNKVAKSLRRLLNKALVLVLGLHCSFYVQSQALNTDVDFSTRADFRSEKTPRYQYRLRLYPQLRFADEAWSLNAFAVTGDEFSSSYNTFGADENHHFHLRRVYMRHSSASGKTEFGSIPTYKGRVSSTGLSKDGWITGLRQVYHFSEQTQIEWVVGELDHVQESSAFQTPESLNYLEFEISSTLNEWWGYELGLERMLDENFVRGELRYKFKSSETVALEVVHRADNQQSKLVLSLEGDISLLDTDMEYFWYYSYVDSGFGARAELTEDFVDFGHAMTFELEGALWKETGLEWFSKLELNEGQQRFQLGMKFKL